MPPKKHCKQEDVTEPSQWMFLMPDSLLNTNKDNDIQICKLRHPRTDLGSLFVISEETRRIFELTQFKEDFRSWFIDESVQKDGCMYISTPMDARFLVLPYFIKAAQTNKFSPLEQIIEDDEYHDCNQLSNQPRGIDQICDIKGNDDMLVYRYNEEKTLSWLETKVKRTINTLKSENIHVGPGYVVDTYVANKKNDLDEEYFTSYAYELVSEYLPVRLSARLKDHLGIKELTKSVDVENTDLRSPPIDQPPNKKQKLDPNAAPNEDYSQILKPLKQKTNLTSTQKKLEKMDKKGMRSITSFFGGKPKT